MDMLLYKQVVVRKLPETHRLLHTVLPKILFYKMKVTYQRIEENLDMPLDQSSNRYIIYLP